MNLAELRSLYRLAAGDSAVPPLWTDAEIDAYLNEAENEAADRASLIYDDTSAATSIPLVIGTKRYATGMGIVRIDYAKLDDQDIDVIDRIESGPRAVFVIPESDSIELNFTPEAAGTLQLGVYRLPAAPMSLDVDTPEIAARHHFKLLDWALHLGYLKTDSDTFDQGKADHHETEFAKNFGQRVDANVRRKQKERRRHTTRINW